MPKRVTPEDADPRDPEMTLRDSVPYVDDDGDDGGATVSLAERIPPLSRDEQPVASEDEEVAAAAEETEESSAEIAEDASVRRSRREGKKSPKINLDEIEEFRKFKAESDRRLAEERKRREELERVWQEEQARLAQIKRQEIAQRLADVDEEDLVEKQRLLDEYAQIAWQQNQAQLARWRAEKKRLLEEMGLDPSDERFDDLKYADDPNTAWYRLERDAAKAAAELAHKRAREAEGKLADLPKLIREEVAKHLARTGMAAADLGEDGSAPPAFSREEWARDARLVQLGRLSPEAYLRKWGERP